ncbi:heterokaryon incompatibility protein-domain-containing protein [Podospora conica]|nr:heterokaryon incompatibility protein-domain-containing protein [Schizothecium conicum]
MLQRFRRKKPVPPDPPCSVCQNLSITDQPLSISMSHLRTSALRISPCPCCSLIWTLISSITSPDTVHPDIAYTNILFSHPSDLKRHPNPPLHGHLLPNTHLGGTPIPGHTLQFYTLPSSPPSPYPSIGTTPSIPSHALSSLPLLRSWLTTCTTHHPLCSPPSRHPPLPTRLIDVRPALPRLHLPSTTTTGPYAALSHSWTGRPTARTLTPTIPALPHPLPRTFADAITVTRALDIPFLWIDALCIIQDDRADWAREAARMGDVYAHALVTISAEAAADADAGFLDRSVGREVGVPVGGDGGATVYVRKRGVVAGEEPVHSLPGDGDGDGGLATRGWVFQERVLSRRMVYFSRGEMGWECRAGWGCECRGAAVGRERAGSVVKRFLMEGDAGAPGGLGVVWRREVVPVYTGLELTVVKDRLPALEGLAREMGGLRGGGGYLWGLWRETLGRDLLWRSEGGGGGLKTRGRPEREGRGHEWEVEGVDLEFLPEGYAPTWSWGSVVGQVLYDVDEGDDGVGFEVAGVRPSDEEGERPCVLQGRGCAVEVTLKWARRDIVVPVGADNSPPFERRPSQPGQTPLVELGVVWDHRKEGGADANAVYTFLVFGSRGRKRGPFGLILRPIGKPGEVMRFKRVGFIGGYRSIEPRARQWGSGGWETDAESHVHAFVTGHRDRGSRDEDIDLWDEWTETVLKSEVQREVEIV